MFEIFPDSIFDPMEQAAEEMGISLRPREGKVFDEVTDIVDCDMVIVMDRFDHEEVHFFDL